MKVLMITPAFHPHVGGVETHVLQVCKHLHAVGIECTIATPRFRASLADREQFEGLEVIRYPPRHLFVKWLWVIANARTIVQADVVHCHDFTYFVYFPFRFIFPRKRVFETFHGYEGYPIKRHDVLLRILIRAFSTATVCVGAYIERWYRTRCDRIVYGGPRTSQTTVQVKPRTAVYVGRLDKGTAVDDFVRALILLKERHSIDLCVDFVGDGVLRPELEDLARHKNLRLMFHGFVRDPTEYFARSEIVFAGGYLSIIEALSLGKPVFALHRDSVRRDYLSCFPGRDVVVIAKTAEELAEEITRFYQEPSTIPALRAAAKEAASQFSWDSVAREYAELYRSALSQIVE